MKFLAILIIIFLILNIFKTSSATLRFASGAIGTLIIVLLVLKFLGFAVTLFFKIALVIGVVYLIGWLINVIRGKRK